MKNNGLLTFRFTDTVSLQEAVNKNGKGTRRCHICESKYPSRVERMAILDRSAGQRLNEYQLTVNSYTPTSWWLATGVPCLLPSLPAPPAPPCRGSSSSR